MRRKASALVLSLVAGGAAHASEVPVVLQETYVTERDEAMNVDSVALHASPGGGMWLFATAKEGDLIRIYDAATGRRLRDFGGPGAGVGQFERPNGIVAEDGLLIVVERDNHRVQAFALPALTPLGTFGAERLVRPYGAYLQAVDGSGAYRLYVTDNYETADGRVPAEAELGRRVVVWSLTVARDAAGAAQRLATVAAGTFGATSGPGVLRVVESIAGDPRRNRLLIAEEDPAGGRVLKGYTLDGQFRDEIVGDGVFATQPEGIVLYECGERGYWIATDQDYTHNVFHVFDRDTLEHVGAFEGAVTRNTDGIALMPRAFDQFPSGAFFAVHDDQAVAAFDWRVIARALELPPACGGR